MKGNLIILLLGFLIFFSGCNLIKNLGKTKDERKKERKEKRARRLVNKAARVDPSILHFDTIRIPSTHIDSSIHVDTNIHFVDSIIDRIIHSLDDSRSHITGNSQLDREAVREWSIKVMKDSILKRDLIKDTITHQFLEDGIVYTFKFWDHKGKIFYDFEKSEKLIFYKQIIIKALTVWEKLTWWAKGLFWLFLIILFSFIFKWTYKRFLGYK